MQIVDQVRERASPAFWFGASIALPMGLFSVPMVAWSGMALVNGWWRAFHGGADSPSVIGFVGGILYGILAGPCLASAVVGIAFHYLWKLIYRFKAIKMVQERTLVVGVLGAWLAIEALYYFSSVWIIFTMAAYTFGAVGAGGFGYLH